EADGPLLAGGAPAQPEGELVAAPEEVALREIQRADEAVDGGEATADGEQARGLLGHLDVDDGLRTVRPGLGGSHHVVEIAEVHEALSGALELLQGEELALLHGELAAQHLVLAAQVAADVDALDV